MTAAELDVSHVLAVADRAIGPLSDAKLMKLRAALDELAKMSPAARAGDRKAAIADLRFRIHQECSPFAGVHE